MALGHIPTVEDGSTGWDTGSSRDRMRTGGPADRVATRASSDTSDSAAGDTGDIQALGQSSDTSGTSVVRLQDWERALQALVTPVTP